MRRNRWAQIICANLVAFILCQSVMILWLRDIVYAQELSAQEMVKRADDLLRGETSQGKYRMAVITPQWRRTLELYAYSSGRDKIFIRILSPAKECGITTLRVETNMWNYIPQVERTIKIPPSMMLMPWMGSDFTNDDLVKESSIVYDYNHRLLEEEKINDEIVYKIELLPKPEAKVVWGKLLYWIRKKDHVPLRIEYYREDGKLIKVLNYSQFKEVSDRTLPTYWEMTSLTKENHRTIIEILEVEYDKTLDENIFTLQYMKSK